MSKLVSRLGLVIFIFFVSMPKASAALDDSNVIDNLIGKYQSVADKWGSVITGHATSIFWLLVVISLVWTFGMLALRRAEIGEFIAEAVRFVMFTGFYFWLLTNGPSFAKKIIDSLFSIGSEAGASDQALMPSDIVKIGFKIWDHTFSKMNWLDVGSSVVAGVLAIIILAVLAFVSVNVVLVLLSSWILMYAGVIYLGFGGSRWTSDMAINYYRAVLGTGVKVMAMMLIIGIAGKFLGDCFNQMSGDLNIHDLGVMLVLSIAIAILASKVPDMVAGIVSGSGAHYGAGHLAIGTVTGAAMMAASMAVRTVTTATGGAEAVAGGGIGQGLRAAFESAQQHIGNSVGRTGGSNSGGGFGGHMTSSLVQSAAATAKAGAKDVTSSMQDRMAQTTGGRVASEIREKSAGVSGGIPAQEPVQESPLTADEARGFLGPESAPDVRAEAQDFINGSSEYEKA